jgi:DNA invertase Pin-like site-specific DNA recombinase
VAGKKQLHAVSYLRVSGKGQLEGDGFDRQREAVARFAKANGYSIVDEFLDEGVSGTRELEDRPGLASVLDRIEQNGVRIVLVERADRLARDLMVSEVILSQFRQAGARVLTADGVDLTVSDDDPTRTLIRQVLAAVAQFDKAVVVLKLRAARVRIRKRQGVCEGAKPFGSYPGEMLVMERIRALRRKPTKGRRASFASIASTLNQEGFTNRAGRPWSPRMAFHIFHHARQPNRSV